MGVGLVLLGWHFPSDVIGGFLIAALWAAGAVGWLRWAGAREAVTLAPVPRLRAGMIAALVLAAVFTVAAAAAIALRIGDLDQAAELGRLRTAFIGGSALIGLLALAVPPSIAALLLERPADAPGAAPP